MHGGRVWRPANSVSAGVIPRVFSGNPVDLGRANPKSLIKTLENDERRDLHANDIRDWILALRALT